MNPTKSSSMRRSSIFLMELILAILFFSLAAAICIRMFAQTHVVGQANRVRTAAILHVQSAAECFESADHSILSMQDYPEVFPTEATVYDDASNQMTVYYNTAFQPCTPDEAAYQAHHARRLWRISGNCQSYLAKDRTRWECNGHLYASRPSCFVTLCIGFWIHSYTVIVHDKMCTRIHIL